MLEVQTDHGPAHVHLRVPAGARAGLVLGHGAGGGIGAPDLVAASTAAEGLGIGVALVEQPYRVAGRRSPAPAGQLDAAWLAVVQRLREHELSGAQLIVGGRSAGARVACRTSAESAALGVLCLAFPLQPPPRRSGTRGPSRLGELDAVAVPTLVVQGDNDRFGMPPPGPHREVVVVPGDHSLRRAASAVTAATADWLAQILGAG